jgi:hypothetical protein
LSPFGPFVVADSKVVFNVHQLLAKALWPMSKFNFVGLEVSFRNDDIH